MAEVRRDLLAPSDVARMIGCSRLSVYRMVRDGRLPAFRLGGNPTAPLRIRREDLEQLLVPVAPGDGS
jgi:excisionase family DNA binding protein